MATAPVGGWARDRMGLDGAREADTGLIYILNQGLGLGDGTELGDDDYFKNASWAEWVLGGGGEERGGCVMGVGKGWKDMYDRIVPPYIVAIYE